MHSLSWVSLFYTVRSDKRKQVVIDSTSCPSDGRAAKRNNDMQGILDDAKCIAAGRLYRVTRKIPAQYRLFAGAIVRSQFVLIYLHTVTFRPTPYTYMVAELFIDMKRSIKKL